MDNCESLRHTKWECKYHVVFIPKGRRKKLYSSVRGGISRSQQKESQILEGHLFVDHGNSGWAASPGLAGR